ncbi:MAG: hypothetical protein IJC07_00785 [Clostridia bacterium]|nr:hypothetical protein [Clostridia bacterium]
MFVSKNQFFVFIACIAFGGLVGILFGIVSIFKKRLNVYVGAVLDVLCFVFVSILYVGYSFLLKFPNFRVYMTVGVLLGILIYFKSFNIILAKIAQKIYNIFRKYIKRQKHDRRKEKKINNGIESGCCGVACVSNCNTHLSNREKNLLQQKNKKSRSRNNSLRKANRRRQERIRTS